MLNKKTVLIQVFDNCTDLRVTGSNLDTGMKAFFHVKGKNQGYKIYMSNNGSSISCYIKQKGINHSLQNDLMIGSMSPYKLTQLVDWYVNIEK